MNQEKMEQIKITLELMRISSGKEGQKTVTKLKSTLSNSQKKITQKAMQQLTNARIVDNDGTIPPQTAFILNKIKF